MALPTQVMIPELKPGDALLLVDPQVDFCPGGALGIAAGDQVIPVMNRWSDAAERAGIPIFISRDWHPERTTHFSTMGGVWPPHCVAGTPGADFHPEFRFPPSAILVSKGMGDTENAYSAFQARDADGRRLSDLLRERGVRHLYLMGLATDYCVKESSLSAAAEGLRFTVVAEGIRAVNLLPGDDERALAAIRSAGGEILGVAR